MLEKRRQVSGQYLSPTWEDMIKRVSAARGWQIKKKAKRFGESSGRCAANWVSGKGSRKRGRGMWGRTKIHVKRGGGGVLKRRGVDCITPWDTRGGSGNEMTGTGLELLNATPYEGTTGLGQGAFGGHRGGSIIAWVWEGRPAAGTSAMVKLEKFTEHRVWGIDKGVGRGRHG